MAEVGIQESVVSEPSSVYIEAKVGGKRTAIGSLADS
jgi:hypothetical protein